MASSGRSGSRQRCGLDAANAFSRAQILIGHAWRERIDAAVCAPPSGIGSARDPRATSLQAAIKPGANSGLLRVGVIAASRSDAAGTVTHVNA